MPRLVPVLLAVAWSMGAMAQGTAGAVDEPDRATARRIAALSASLDPVNRRRGTDAEWEIERERRTLAIRREVTNLVETSIEPSRPAAAVQARLQAVLAAQPPALEFSDPPRARRADLRFGRALVVSYTVVRPPHFDSGVIAGFRDDGGRYRLVATAGAELAGHTMFTLEVRSPHAQEIWLLAGGQAQTFNGARFRFRLYAFDGREFRSVWAPDDVYNASVQVTAEGFAITHVPPAAQARVTDAYVATVNGVGRVR